MNQATNAAPAPTVVIGAVRYTTRATAAQLAAVFHQAGPWGDASFDPTTTTWTLCGTPLKLLPALERAGIVLEGPGDTQGDEDAGALLAPVPADDDLRERLAALEHDRWSRWMRHLFNQGSGNTDGTWTMPAWAVERWQRQVATPYAELSEAEKDSDRAEADRTLQLLGRSTEAAVVERQVEA